jgi:hypothetical protein
MIALRSRIIGGEMILLSAVWKKQEQKRNFFFMMGRNAFKFIWKKGGEEKIKNRYQINS